MNKEQSHEAVVSTFKGLLAVVAPLVAALPTGEAGPFLVRLALMISPRIAALFVAALGQREALRALIPQPTPEQVLTFFERQEELKRKYKAHLKRSRLDRDQVFKELREVYLVLRFGTSPKGITDAMRQMRQPELSARFVADLVIQNRQALGNPGPAILQMIRTNEHLENLKRSHHIVYAPAIYQQLLELNTFPLTHDPELNDQLRIAWWDFLSKNGLRESTEVVA